MRLDHVIVAVTDLEQAMADYRTLGFTVIFGGQHAGGVTHNALICLADGSYIELIAPIDPATPPAASPYLGGGQGFAGFALLADDLSVPASRLRYAGVAYAGPTRGGRARADGVELIWESLFLHESIAPFLIRDVTPRALRVADDPALLAHANGATGIAEVHVATSDWSTSAAQYAALFGATASYAEESGRPSGAVAYRLDGCRVFLRPVALPMAGEAEPARQAGTAPVPYLCRLTTVNSSSVAPLRSALSHSAHFELIGEGAAR